MKLDAAQFRTLMGRFATGVTVLTVRRPGPEGRPVGMTASSIASASLDPPLVLVCVDRTHDIHPFLESRQSFALSILAADQEDVSRRFAAFEGDRFEGVRYHDAGNGLPVIDGAAAFVECEWHSSFPAGDHTIFLGRVTGGEVTDRRPLLHYRGGYAALVDR